MERKATTRAKTHRPARDKRTDEQKAADRAVLLAAIRAKHERKRATTALLAKEFPDFDVTTLPVIPVGFVDSSWHNDACPSFAYGDLQLFVDYADPAVRECGADSPRYVLVEEQADGTTKTLAMTDDWSAMLAAIKAVPQ